MTPPTPEPPVIFPYDFYHFWAAGRVTLEGGNPYDNPSVYAQMLNAGWPLSEGFHGFLHPPWTMWLFVPLGSLSIDAAVTVWTILSLLIAGLGFFLVKNWISSRCESPSHLPLFALAFAYATFPPLMSTVWLGQTNILILLGILLFAYLADRQKDFLGGAALSLVLIKPQLFIAFFFALLLFLIRNRRAWILIGLALGFFAQVLISLILAPGASAQFLAGAQSMASGSVVLPGASLAQTLHLFIPQLWIFPFVGVCGIGSALWLSYRTKEDWMRHLLFVSLPLSLLTAPYVWSHAFLPLLLPYLALISNRLQTHEASTIRVHGLFSMFGVCEAIRPFHLAPLMGLLPVSILGIELRKKGAQR